MTIKKIGPGKFELESKSKGKDGKRKNLGIFRTRKAALKHEGQVEYFKHRGE